MTNLYTKPTIEWPRGATQDMVNDWFAKRLAEEMRTIYKWLFPGCIHFFSGTITNKSPVVNGTQLNEWKICDGSTYGGITTPDLRNKFLRMEATSGTIDGADSLTLVTANLPAHSHTVNNHNHTVPNHKHAISKVKYYSTFGSHRHSSVAPGYMSEASDPNDGNATASETDNKTGLSTNNTGLTTNNTGSGTAIDNKPAYYSLVPIMKVY